MHRQVVLILLPAMVSKVQHSSEQAAAQAHMEAPAMSAACGGACHVSLLPCVVVLACLVLHMQ